MKEGKKLKYRLQQDAFEYLNSKNAAV